MLTTMRNINIAPDTGVKKPTRKARSSYHGPYMTLHYGANPRWLCVLFTRNSIE